MNRKDAYLRLALEQIPRLLGLLDKVKESPTYGCFDRQYWNYRTKDFSSIISQYATLSLALLYSIDNRENTWFRSSQIKEWCIGSMLFWTRLQHKDGSFDEAYSGDHSQPGTAFSLYFIAEAYNILKDELDEVARALLLDRMKKAAYFVWNCKGGDGAERGDPEVSNHDAGTTAALYMMYKLTKDEKYKAYALTVLKSLLSRQSKEGWFPEYGGADVGYSTVTLYFLANYFRLSNDNSILFPLEKLLEFISYFVHPDGSMGGEYGSRDTCVVLPSGFEIMAKQFKLAGAISSLHYNAISTLKTPTPLCYDDANLLCFPFISYLQAYIFSTNDNEDTSIIPSEREGGFRRFFEESGLLVFKTDTYYSIVSTKKGGVIKIYGTEKKELILNDTGWVGRMNGGMITSSKYNPNVKLELVKDTIKICTNFCYISDSTLLVPLKTAISRVLFLMISPFSFLRISIKGVLRRKLITALRKSHFLLQRTINFRENNIQIHDILQGFKGSNVQDLHISAHYSPRYCFTKGLYSSMPQCTQPPFVLKTQKLSKIMEVTRRFDAQRGEVTVLKKGI